MRCVPQAWRACGEHRFCVRGLAQAAHPGWLCLIVENEPLKNGLPQELGQVQHPGPCQCAIAQHDPVEEQGIAPKCLRHCNTQHMRQVRQSDEEGDSLISSEPCTNRAGKALPAGSMLRKQAIELQEPQELPWATVLAVLVRALGATCVTLTSSCTMAGLRAAA